MVNNIGNVLDEGTIKYLKETIMVPKHLRKFQNNVKELQKLHYDIDFLKKTRDQWGEDEHLELEMLIETRDKLWNPIYQGYLSEIRVHEIKDNLKIAEFMGVTPFYPCVMFNISPNWKGMFGKDDVSDKMMIKNFTKVIDSYLNEQFTGKPRYTKYKYCLECGSEGNFLHAHVVAEINPALLKAMKTHINKGNHKQQFCKYWNKMMPKGNQGQLKGEYAIQRVLINTREIRKDKLKYLKEKNKEEGHKNLKDLKLVFGGF